MADSDETDSKSVPSAASPDDAAIDDTEVADLDPDQVGQRIEPLDFEVDDAQIAAESAAEKANTPAPTRGRRPVRRSTVEEELAESPDSPDDSGSPDSPAGSDAGLGAKRPQRKQSDQKSSTGVKKASRKKKARQRTGPAQFSRESVGELKRVIWPSMPQLRQYFVVVLLFVLFIIAYVGALDMGFGALLLWLFGQSS